MERLRLNRGLQIFRMMIFWPSGRYSKTILSLLLHPVTLSLPVTLFFVWIIPDYFEKYTVQLIAEKIYDKGTTVYHWDIDHDGNSERFLAGRNNNGGSCVTVYNKWGVIHQWDFEGEYIPENQKCMMGDVDLNGQDEIYAFTLKDDSLIMNGIDFRNRKSCILANKFITRFGKSKDANSLEDIRTDVRIQPVAMADLDGDTYKEIVIAVGTGYGLSPRRLFAIDLKKDTIYSSPELGGHFGTIQQADVDHDGKPEFAISNYGPGNITDKTLPMQDDCAYVLVLDNTLQFLFPPIPSPGVYNSINNSFLRYRDSMYLSTFWDFNNQVSGESVFRIYDSKGKLIREKKLPPRYMTKDFGLLVVPKDKRNDRILLFPDYGDIEAYDGLLDPARLDPVRNGNMVGSLYDFDQDGEQEVFFRSEIPDEWVIVRNTISHPVQFKVGYSNRFPMINTILKVGERPQFSFQTDDHLYMLEYGFNKMHYWQFPIYLGIFLGVLGFILIIQKIAKVQIHRKFETEKRILELQVSTMHNQMDSHFTFNVLSTIGSSILQEQKEMAYALLGKFSRLLRYSITESDSLTRSLYDEIRFVEDFLDIQQSRFKDLFEYSIHMDKQVSQGLRIPRGCIQTYVENSIKHGISSMQKGGKINIEIKRKDHIVTISMEDNGIGRKKASERKKISTGKGIEIMHQYYQLLNKSNPEPITEEITDLMDDHGKGIGTRVTIRVPVDYNYFRT